MLKPHGLQQITQKEKDRGERARRQYVAVTVQLVTIDPKPQQHQQRAEKESEQQERKGRDLLKRGFGRGKRGTPDDGRQ